MTVFWLHFFPLVLVYVPRSHETQANTTKILSWLQMTGLTDHLWLEHTERLFAGRWYELSIRHWFTVRFLRPEERSLLVRCLCSAVTKLSDVCARLRCGIVDTAENPARSTSVTDLTIASFTQQQPASASSNTIAIASEQCYQNIVNMTWVLNCQAYIVSPKNAEKCKHWTQCSIHPDARNTAAITDCATRVVCGWNATVPWLPDYAK